MVSQPPPTPVWLQSYQISCHHLPKPPFLGTVYNSMRLKPKKKGMQASSQPVLVTILVFDRRQVGARGKQCQRQTAELTSSLLHKQKLHFLTIYFLEVFQILFIQVKFDCILGSIIPPQPTTLKPMGVRLRATEKKNLKELIHINPYLANNPNCFLYPKMTQLSNCTNNCDPNFNLKDGDYFAVVPNLLGPDPSEDSLKTESSHVHI